MSNPFLCNNSIPNDQRYRIFQRDNRFNDIDRYGGQYSRDSFLPNNIERYGGYYGPTDGTCNFAAAGTTPNTNAAFGQAARNDSVNVATRRNNVMLFRTPPQVVSPNESCINIWLF